MLNRGLVDATGILAMRTLAAGLQGGLTSPARPWFRLSLDDADLARSRPGQAWLDEVANRMPTETTALLDRLGEEWTYSVAINDVYFENATAAFRQAGLTAETAPTNVGAGDGDASALQRIRTGDFQSATVPSPLRSEGWQIIDELNRAMSGEQASGYIPQIHVSTKDNTGEENSWDPVGYQDAYKAIWGK